MQIKVVNMIKNRKVIDLYAVENHILVSYVIMNRRNINLKSVIWYAIIVALNKKIKIFVKNAINQLSLNKKKKKKNKKNKLDI